MDEKPVPDEKLAKPVVEGVCQVCGAALGQQAVVHCTACRTPHHEECWRYAKGCSTFGCGNRTCAPGLAASRPEQSSAEEPFEFSLYEDPGVRARRAVFGLASLMMGCILPPLLTSLFPDFPRIAFAVLALSGFVGCFHFLNASEPWSLRVEPGRDAITRFWRFFGQLTSEDRQWLRREDVLALHVYGEPPVEVAAVTRSGESRALVRQGKLASSDDLRELVPKLARWADCTVTEYGTSPRPTRAELEDLARRSATEEVPAGPAAPLLPPSKL